MSEFVRHNYPRTEHETIVTLLTNKCFRAADAAARVVKTIDRKTIAQ